MFNGGKVKKIAQNNLILFIYAVSTKSLKAPLFISTWNFLYI